ncbi:MAG: hypothetical protein JOZ52_01765, partial [Acidobacteria bacterium]|nr:hypothetical protein [Acidobacteriota bacterium]
MSYRNQQALDYEPVTRRGDALARSSDEEFPAPTAFEFPVPRFDEAADEAAPENPDRENPERVAVKAPASQDREDKRGRRRLPRHLRPESWIV